jgi:hypothetical protein
MVRVVKREQNIPDSGGSAIIFVMYF